MPWASLAIRFAVAGATTSAAASVVSEMCATSVFRPGAHWSLITGRRVSASKVSGVTNRCAPCVRIATTSWPRFCRPRTTSAAL